MAATTIDESAEALETRARQAEQGAAELERRHLAGEEDAELAAIDAAREDARKLRWQAKSARHREAAREAADRAEALAALGSDIRAAAGGTSTEGLAAKLAQLAADGDGLRQVVAEYDGGVSALCARARALGVAGHAPCGPRPDNGGIALTRSGVQVGETELRPLGDVRGLLAAAVNGEEPRIPEVVITHAPPVRPAHAIVGRGLVVHGVNEITEALQTQIDTGASVVLTDAELGEWWAGVLDITSIDLDARRSEQVSAAKAREKARWETIHASQREAMEASERAAQERAASRAGRN